MGKKAKSAITVLAITAMTVLGGIDGAGQSSKKVMNMMPATTHNDPSYDVFYPLAKYIASADVEALSAWFAPALEMVITGKSSDCSKNQAKQILKAFFKHYTPRSFEINHQAGRENMKYACGILNASGEYFIVTIFVCYLPDTGFQIQQMKIDRLD